MNALRTKPPEKQWIIVW